MAGVEKSCLENTGWDDRRMVIYFRRRILRKRLFLSRLKYLNNLLAITEET